MRWAEERLNYLIAYQEEVQRSTSLGNFRAIDAPAEARGLWSLPLAKGGMIYGKFNRKRMDIGSAIAHVAKTPELPSLGTDGQQ